MAVALRSLAIFLLLSAAACERIDRATDATGTHEQNIPSRQATNMQQALLGHWQSTSGTDQFFGPSTITRIERGSQPEILNYIVQKADSSSSTLLLKVSIPTGSHWMELSFSPDKNSFSQSVWLEGDKFKMPSKSSHYLDEKQAP